MNLGKLLSTVQRAALYFRRLDGFEDQYEGIFTQPMHENINLITLKSLIHLPQEEIQRDFQQLRDMLLQQLLDAKDSRKKFYINCWHLNEEESSAMWKLYTAQSESIAICTTFEKLSNILPKEIFLGKVRYIDYRKDYIGLDNALWQSINKRKSFQHENEVRAVLYTWPDTFTKHEWIERADEKGFYIKCNINNAIDRVYVSPSSDPEFRNVVAKVLRMYGINAPVVQSEVDAPPAY